MCPLLRNSVAASAAVLALAGVATAQTTVVLPDTSQTTMVSVTISEQAKVSVPTGVAFSVSDIGTTTAAAGATLTVSQIVLGSATGQLRVLLRANAPAFTPPVNGAATWSAGDISWNAAVWSSGIGSGGTLSQASFGTVATCDAGVPSCATSSLVFSLAPKPAVQRSGSHTLTVTWKFESIGF